MGKSIDVSCECVILCTILNRFSIYSSTVPTLRGLHDTSALLSGKLSKVHYMSDCHRLTVYNTLLTVGGSAMVACLKNLHIYVHESVGILMGSSE